MCDYETCPHNLQGICLAEADLETSAIRCPYD